MQFCKIHRKELKSKILTLLIYLVVLMIREWQYLDSGLLGGIKLTLMIIAWSIVTLETEIIESSKPLIYSV